MLEKMSKLDYLFHCERSIDVNKFRVCLKNIRSLYIYYNLSRSDEAMPRR